MIAVIIIIIIIIIITAIECSLYQCSVANLALF
jgi:hypothetical protein